MPLHPAPLRLVVPAALLTLLAAAAAAAPALPPRPSPAQAPAVAFDAARAAALAVAQDRAAHAAAAIDDLKRELGPGHLTDPMPDTDRAFGLASLRADYADAQRRAAGYRATLGDQHPTLLATVQLMDDLRAQLLDGTRKALVSAERDAADARAALPDAHAADVTGSIAAAPRPAARVASPLSLPPAAVAAAADRPGPVEAAPATAPNRAPSRALAAAGAAALLAALLAGWAALRLLRPRRPRVAPARRVEPALATPAAVRPELIPEHAPPRPTPAEAVPVLQRLTLPRPADAPAATLADARDRDGAAAGLHATLRDAFGGEAAARMTVLVSPAAGLPVAMADAAALALARAAAAAGGRPLLMEARAAGRLRGAFVPADATPMLIEAGGAARTLYRLGDGPAVALLPGDAGEAEAAAAAAARADTARLRGLDVFDTVILVGDDAAALASSADLVLLAAPIDAAPAALAEAARPLRGAGRPCGAVLVAGPAARTAPSPRRRPAEAAPAVRPNGAARDNPRHAASPPRGIEQASAGSPPQTRSGLRGTIEPARRRIGG